MIKQALLRGHDTTEGSTCNSAILDATTAVSRLGLVADVAGSPQEEDEDKKKYDPGGAVAMWKKPKRHKRPFAFVRYNVKSKRRVEQRRPKKRVRQR